MKPSASISLDLDNKWSYLKTHGDKSWREFPSYLHLVVPRFLEAMDDLDLTITVMIVGQDAARPENRELLRMVVEAEHEIGNHSFDHEPWLHLYDKTRLKSDFDRSEEAIGEATGIKPRGFRGPGFSLSRDALEEISKRGYEYDATLLPNLLNPLGRMYYLIKSDLTKDERLQRKALFGTMGDALRPNRPFHWDLSDNRQLLEIPVTTMPLFKIPFHMSYLIYLSSYSVRLAQAYLRTALSLSRLTKTPPSMLLHPLDFLGADDDTDLGFFPGMNLKAAVKMELVKRHLGVIMESFGLLPLGSYAKDLSPTKTRIPHFRQESPVSEEQPR